MQQRQVIAQVKMRQAVDNVAEKDHREKNDDDHGQKLHGENVAEILHIMKIG